LSDYKCSGLCEKGFYCPLNSTSGRQVPCPAGRYGATAGLADDHCTAICPMGHYCPLGSFEPVPCPAGTYGNVSGLTNAACSMQCWAANSDLSNARSTVIALLEQAEINTNLPSWALLHEWDQDSLSRRHFWCFRRPVHWRMLWPMSLRAFLSGGIVFSFSVLQARIIYHVTSRFERQCGFHFSSSLISENSTDSNSVFCPDGSSEPLLVQVGYYSIGFNRTIRDSTTPCHPGSYCSNGIVNDCPAGRFGAVERLSDARCSGPCKKGHYCPPGSTSEVQFPCPIGRYGDKEGLTDAFCSGG
ncbi:unnamed protein product, partial [Ectocarpus fasciculatus]